MRCEDPSAFECVWKMLRRMEVCALKWPASLVSGYACFAWFSVPTFEKISSMATQRALEPTILWLEKYKPSWRTAGCKSFVKASLVLGASKWSNQGTWFCWFFDKAFFLFCLLASTSPPWGAPLAPAAGPFLDSNSAACLADLGKPAATRFCFSNLCFSWIARRSAFVISFWAFFGASPLWGRVFSFFLAFSLLLAEGFWPSSDVMLFLRPPAAREEPFLLSSPADSQRFS